MFVRMGASHGHWGTACEVLNTQFQFMQLGADRPSAVDNHVACALTLQNTISTQHLFCVDTQMLSLVSDPCVYYVFTHTLLL